MADQWNDNIPVMGNQISADIPDIEENFGHIRSSLERIFETWSTASGGNSSAKFDSATGFYDGTYNYEFPTNGVAGDSVIMLGDSDTIAWFYLNTAPPGWKLISTGADSVLAIHADSGDYNVNGGNPDTSNTWTIDGFSVGNDSNDHTHTLATSGTQTGIDSSRKVHIDTGILYSSVGGGATTKDAASSTTGGVSAAHNHGVTQNGSWRPKGSVGRLYQLDTA